MRQRGLAPAKKKKKKTKKRKKVGKKEI